jgi:hypothetical protein
MALLLSEIAAADRWVRKAAQHRFDTTATQAHRNRWRDRGFATTG